MSKFLLNLLVEFLKVLPNSKILGNSKIKFQLNLSWDLAQSVALVHLSLAGYRLTQPTQ
jgi:hypothetical protein